MEEQNIARKVFHNELTWIGMIIFSGWGIVTQIILPINTIQVSLEQIQVILNTNTKQTFKNSNDIIILQQQMADIMSNKK